MSVIKSGTLFLSAFRPATIVLPGVAPQAPKNSAIRNEVMRRASSLAFAFSAMAAVRAF